MNDINFSGLEQLSGWPKDKLHTLNGLEVLANIGNPQAPLKFESKIVVDQVYQQVLGQFAAQNGWEYKPVDASLVFGFKQNNKLVIPSWMMNFPQRSATHIVRGGFFGNFVCDLFTYAVYDQASEVDRSHDQKIVLAITLPKVVPQMLLDSHKNDRRHMSSVSRAYEVSQRGSASRATLIVILISMHQKIYKLMH